MTNCILCGFPSHGAYCHAHGWAAGQEIPSEQEFRNASKGGVEITDLHDYWMERYTQSEVSELAAYIEEIAI